MLYHIYIITPFEKELKRVLTFSNGLKVVSKMYERKVGFNFNIRVQLYKQFKMLCLMENQSMTSRINEMIEKDIARYQREKHIKL